LPIFQGAIANLLVPLKQSEGSIGFIACISEQPRIWSSSEIEFLQAIAQQLEMPSVKLSFMSKPRNKLKESNW
jgi:GAF domain-containing protein